MKTLAFDMGSGLGLLVGIAVAYVVWATLQGRSLPMLSGVRGAFWAVVVLGVVACALGGIGTGLVRAGGSWTDPFILGGIVFGVAALAVIVAFATGARLPFLADDRAALLAITGLVAAKFVLSTAHGLTALVR